MRLLLSACCFALAGAACVPTDTPVRIEGAHPLTSELECKAAEAQQYRGSLDLSGSTSYYLQFDVASDLQQITTSVGGEVLDGPDRNTFFANQLVFSYRSSDPAFGTLQETINSHMVIKSGDAAWIRLDLLTPKAVDRLLSVVGASPLELEVTFELRGQLGSGQAIRSSAVTYPIQIFKSGFAGCTTSAIAPTGPCGSAGGQDGTAPGCCSDPLFAKLCGAP